MRRRSGRTFCTSSPTIARSRTSTPRKSTASALSTPRKASAAISFTSTPRCRWRPSASIWPTTATPAARRSTTPSISWSSCSAPRSRPKRRCCRPPGAALYRGRINNFYAALGKPRRMVTVHDLRDALECRPGRQAGRQPETQAVGCFIPERPFTMRSTSTSITAHEDCALIDSSRSCAIIVSYRVEREFFRLSAPGFTTQNSSKASPMIKVEGVTKRYGPATAVKNVSFNVERGEIVGFLGPNGAGKTTTMRILTAFCRPPRNRGGWRLRRSKRPD